MEKSRGYNTISRSQEYKARKVWLRAEKEIGKQAKGFYLRPSAAVERGGGFFIPGLEGDKLRIFGGGLLLALLTANHASPTAGSGGMSLAISEIVAAATALAIIVPYLLPEAEEATTIRRRLVVFADDDTIVSEDQARWAASTVATSTPARGLALLRNRKHLLLLDAMPGIETPSDLDLDGLATTQHEDYYLLDRSKRANKNAFALFPNDCDYIALVPCRRDNDLNHELEWFIGIRRKDDLLPTDCRFCSRLLLPPEISSSF